MNKYIWQTSPRLAAFLPLACGAGARVLLYRNRDLRPGKKTDSARARSSRVRAANRDLQGHCAKTSSAHSMFPLFQSNLRQERIQSIGVKSGSVEYQQLSDDIRATGTVATDETRISYVQIRFFP